MDEVKMPPHSREAEQEVLGGMLRSPEAIGEVLQIIGPDQFYLDCHQKVAKAIIDLYNQGQPAKLGTVAEVLKDRKQIDDIGGYGYLNELLGAAPTSATAPFQASVVRSKAIMRELGAALRSLLHDVENQVASPDELLEAIQQRFSAIAQIGAATEIVDAKTLMDRVYDSIDECANRFRAGKTIIGIPSGLLDLDRKTSGFQNGEFIVIAARTSVGKTSLAISIAQHAAVDLQIPVYVVSFEQPATDLGKRLVSYRSSVDLHLIRSGQLDDDDRREIQSAGSEIRQSPLWIYDRPSRGMLQVAATARLLKRQYGIGLMAVDYLQLVPPEDARVKRYEQLGTISRRLKSLAMELQIPIIAMAQLNRAPDQRASKRPRLSDIRESGDIEQDADTVILLHRPDEDEEEEKKENSPTVEIEVEIAKQRNGPTGRLKLIYRKAFARFENYAPPISESLYNNNGPRD